MISTVAPDTGIPPSLTMGSAALNVVSCTGMAPESVRSTRTTCATKPELSTECTTMLGTVFETVIVPISHDASTAAPATTATAPMTRLEANGDTGGGEKGEWGDRFARRRCLPVVEHVQEDILRVVRIHDAQERGDRRASNVVGTSHVEVEPLRRRQSGGIPRPTDE